MFSCLVLLLDFVISLLLFSVVLMLLFWVLRVGQFVCWFGLFSFAVCFGASGFVFGGLSRFVYVGCLCFWVWFGSFVGVLCCEWVGLMFCDTWGVML